MDAGIEKECSALGGLFQLIMNDMKASYPAWEDFVTKGAKLQSQLRATILVTGAFLDAFQKVADMATGTRGATKEIGSALTRMCMRHRSIESKLKLFTTSLSDSLISPLELKIEEWKKVTSQLDKDHAKEYKKARADIKKKSSDTIKLQKKVKKGKGEARGQLDSALQDVNVRYAVLEETEKKAVVRALVEERARFCSFVTLLKPVLDHEIGMLGEVTHLQTILGDLTNLTAEPNKLPPSSEQVILDLKCSDFSYSYQTPPASPSTLSRKSSISSTYQSGSVRHVPSLDSISCAVDGMDSLGGSTNQLASWSGGPGGSGGAENGSLAPPHNAYTHHAERARAMSASGKSCSAREQLALTLGVGGLNPDAPRTSRDSLHCSSGYSTQTTTPSCSEDTIPSHALKKEPLYVDYESISLHGGDGDSISLHHMRLHSNSSVGHQSDFDKSSTIPRNSDLSFQYRKLMQSKRPASTVSLLAEPERMMGGGLHHSQSHTATIRRKPQSKPAYRRGTISGGVPIPICTPQVPLKATGSGGSEENVFVAPAPGGLSAHQAKLCTSTQSLSALPPPSPSPYYQLVPGQMPIPVPVPTVPNFQEGSGGQQLQQMKYQQQQQQQQQLNQQQQQQQSQHSQQLNHHQQQQLNQQQLNQQQLNQQQLNLQQQLNQQQFHHQQLQQQQLNSQRLHQQQYHLQQQYQQPQQQPVQQTSQQHQFREPHPPQQLHQHHHHHPPQSQPPPPQHPPAAAATAQGQSSDPGLPQAPYPDPVHSTDHHGGGGEQEEEEEEVERERGPLDMVTLIRKVTLRRTVTNDRSAPLLPPPTNHK